MHDPTGPGTPAWNESDRAIDLWITGRRNAAGCAMARMVTHLRANGATTEVVDQWKAFVREMRLDPDRIAELV